uniref:Cobyrinic acid a,c-diamide synthase n=1 Tax=Tetraselmis sp. GSL018 TaxID=582737 RepID=A0A061S2I4_9CHLO
MSSDAPAGSLDCGSELPQGPPEVPAVVIAGTASGVGKTTITLGIISMLRGAGLRVASFKIGPDLLDPQLHRAVSGTVSGSLDAWMMTREQNLAAFALHARGADIAVVEGVMALFDGREGETDDGSTAQMAKWLGLPVLLVLDCAGFGRSAAAVVRGYESFDPETSIGGVILNRIAGPEQVAWLKASMEAAGARSPVIVGMPKDVHLPSYSPSQLLFEQAPDSVVKLAERVAGMLQQSLSPKALLRMAAPARLPPPGPAPGPSAGPAPGPSAPRPLRLKIAIARDEAFCQCYSENLSLLAAGGAQIVEFSPLREPLPLGVSAVLLGGGYPDRHAEALSGNKDCLLGLAGFAAAGGVVYAESAGLAYLARALEPLGGPSYPMAGVLPLVARSTRGHVKMGYVEVETKADSSLFEPGLRARGHIFHSIDLAGSPPGGPPGWRPAFAARPGGAPEAAWSAEGFARGGVLATFAQLHWGSCPRLAAGLLELAANVDVHAASRGTEDAVASGQPYVIRSPDSDSPREALADAGAVARLPSATKHMSHQALANGDGQAGDGPEAGASADAASCCAGLGDRPIPPSPSRLQRRWSDSLAYMERAFSRSQPLWPTGAEQPLPAVGSRPRTIVSMLPSGTEIIFALQLQDRLVGVSDLCDFPPEAANYPIAVRSRVDAAKMSAREVTERMKELREAGESPFQIDEALLRRETPGIILTQDTCDICAADSHDAVLAMSSVGRDDSPPTTTVVLRPRTVAEVLETITQVACVCGAPERAIPLVDSLRGRLRAVAAKVARSPRPRPRVVSLEGLVPLVLGGFWIPDIKRLAGGDEVLQEPGDGARVIDWDELRAASPEVLILSPCSMEPKRCLGEVSQLADLPGWWSLPAVVSGEVYICEHVYFSRPGPRLVDGVELLAHILHPETVDCTIPHGQVLKLRLCGGQRCRGSLLPNYFGPLR